MKKFNCVLLVDDDPISLFLHRAAINNTSAVSHTHEVLNGEDALKFISEHCQSTLADLSCPDLVLLDLNMPIMDGFEFLEALEKSGLRSQNNIRIVIVSSSSNPKDHERAKQHNVWKYLNKPLTKAAIESLQV
jgi:CheY-like chemotaxis protein